MPRKSIMNIPIMLDKIEWKMLEPTRNFGERMDSDEIFVRFFPNNAKDKNIVNRVMISIGKNIMDEMRWFTKDRICVLQDPDNLLRFQLVKSESGKGFSLQKQNPSCTQHTISFAWNIKEIKLELRRSLPVDYYVYKGNILIFTVDLNQK